MVNEVIKEVAVGSYVGPEGATINYLVAVTGDGRLLFRHLFEKTDKWTDITPVVQA